MSNSLSNYAFSKQAGEEIVSAYSSAPIIPTPVPSTEGGAQSPWTVFGSFVVPRGIRAKLQVSGINTGPAMMQVACYAPGRIEATVTDVTAGEEQLHFSNSYDFQPGVIYQLAVQYLGSSGLGLVRTVSLVTP